MRSVVACVALGLLATGCREPATASAAPEPAPIVTAIEGDDDGLVAEAAAELAAVGFVVDTSRLKVERLDVVAAMPRFRTHLGRATSPSAYRGQIELARLLLGGEETSRPQADRVLDLAASMLVGNIAAFYDPQAGSVVLLEHDLAKLTSIEHVLVHELVHVYQDQHLPGGVLGMAARAETSDASRVMQLVLEGHAELVALAARKRAEGGSLDDFDPDDINPGLERMLSGEWAAIYMLGLRAMLTAYEQGGWEAVDRLLLEPPSSSEQLLHPVKLERDRPLEIPAPSLPDARLVESTVLGELSIHLALTVAGVSDDQAFLASQGWAGDRMAFYERKGQTVVVWRTAWDRRIDQLDFGGTLLRLPKLHALAYILSPSPQVLDIVIVPPDQVADAEWLTRSLPALDDGSALAVELSRRVEAEFMARRTAREPYLVEGQVVFPQAGIGVPLPEGWQLRQLKGTTLLVAPPQDGFSDNVLVLATPMGGSTFARALEETRATFDRVDTIEVLSFESARVDGHPVAWIELQGAWPNQATTRQLVFVAEHRGQLVQLSATTLPHRWASNGAVLRALLEGVHLFDEGALPARPVAAPSPPSPCGPDGERCPEPAP